MNIWLHIGIWIVVWLVFAFCIMGSSEDNSQEQKELFREIRNLKKEVSELCQKIKGE